MRNEPPQVAQIRSTDCAAWRQARLQNFWRLLGGAGKSRPECWQVSRFRPADRMRRPLCNAGRAPHARHRVAGLSARTSSTLPHSAQVRRQIPRFLDLARGATAPVLAAVPWARVMGMILFDRFLSAAVDPKARSPAGSELDSGAQQVSTRGFRLGA